MRNVFEFQDYRAWIRHQIEAHQSTRGYQNLLAKAAGCQRSFLSRVLHSHVQLTPEHAVGMAQLWNLNRDETEYFLSLVSLSRAGTPKLKALIQRRLDELVERNQTVSSQFPDAKPVEGDLIRLQYYSTWMMMAVHIALTIPKLRTERAIATRLRLSPERVGAILKSLDALGLARKSGEHWRATDMNLHLSSGSILDYVNQAAWRLYIGTRIQENPKGGLHYTGVHSLSRTDLTKLRNLWLDCLKRSREMIGPSPEEELICLSFDLFEL